MTVPDWEQITGGAKVRVALWLFSEVGVGGVFRKAQLRAAFPSIEQIDRRMRDLRAEGWIISTYREDPSLQPDELRLARIGGHVWERGYRSAAANAVSDKVRRQVLAAHNYACGYCGINAGDTYADDPLRSAKVSVLRTSDESGSLVAICERCRAVPPDASLDELVSLLERLDPSQLAQIKRWTRTGRREISDLERIWSMLHRVSAAERDAALRRF